MALNVNNAYFYNSPPALNIDIFYCFCQEHICWWI